MTRTERARFEGLQVRAAELRAALSELWFRAGEVSTNTAGYEREDAELSAGLEWLRQESASLRAQLRAPRSFRHWVLAAAVGLFAFGLAGADALVVAAVVGLGLLVAAMLAVCLAIAASAK
jgi:hypothetical protein